MPKLALAMLCLAMLVSGPVLALTGAPPRPGAPVLVVAPPWAGLDTMIREAGGWPVAPLSPPLARLAQFPEADFAPALRAAGAWAVTDAGRLAAICGGKA